MGFLSRLASMFSAAPKQPEAPTKVTLDFGEAIIKEFEKCVLKPYRDSGGVPTIGWGNTTWEDGKAVSMADKPISQARADDLFHFYYSQFKSKVTLMLPSNTPDRDVGVYTSLAWNIGLSAFAGSTTLRAYKAGDRAKASASLLWWDKDNGQTVLGLQRRRRTEQIIFEGGNDVHAARAQAERELPK